MNIKYIIIICILITIIFILTITNILSMRKNNKIIGAYNFDTKIITSELKNYDRVDSHVKYLMNSFAKNNQIKGSSNNSIKYENENILHKNVKNILSFPEKFQPDYILELDNRYIITEFDEGDDFHSDKKNVAYVKKWLNYNQMIITDNYNDKPAEPMVRQEQSSVVILRITYPNKFEFTELEDKIVYNILSFILGLSAVSCYYLFKFGKDKLLKLVYISKKRIMKNPNNSCNEFYGDRNLHIANINIETGELKATQQSRKLKGGEIKDIIINTADSWVFEEQKEEGNYKVYDITEEIDDLKSEICDLENIITYNLKYLYTKYEDRMCAMFLGFCNNDNYCKIYEKFYDRISNKIISAINSDSIGIYDKLINRKFNKFYNYINDYKKLDDKESLRIFINMMGLLICAFRDNLLSNLYMYEYSDEQKQETQLLHSNIFNEQIVKDFIEKYKDYFIKDIYDLIYYNRNNYAIEQ